MPFLMAQRFTQRGHTCDRDVYGVYLASESGGRLAQLMEFLVIIPDNFFALSERKDVLSAASTAIPKVESFIKAWVEEDLRKIAHTTKQLPPCQ
jgi:hypothetical protein